MLQTVRIHDENSSFNLSSLPRSGNNMSVGSGVDISKKKEVCDDPDSSITFTTNQHRERTQTWFDSSYKKAVSILDFF